ncbi:MAG: hypothetical protein IJ471_09300 [Eubacterium sp.]|nr:hypothetical protein [Eubacterium sp.]
MHISTKYVVEDALAAAALAGEVADMELFSQYQELIITNLDYSKEVFEESLQASLGLSEQGYPPAESVYFESSVPIQIVELTLYNVCQGQVYTTDLLTASGTLSFTEAEGLGASSGCELQGSLLTDTGTYAYSVNMLSGQKKAIKNTSLYAKIQFGISGYDGTVVMVEKDILTDIQQNE